jgi:hypothetical protein
MQVGNWTGYVFDRERDTHVVSRVVASAGERDTHVVSRLVASAGERDTHAVKRARRRSARKEATTTTCMVLFA